MERAYFKLTQEYADVLGGRDSPDFEYYVTLVAQGLAAVSHIHTHTHAHTCPAHDNTHKRRLAY
jgi:hypothetical protein